jgi:hypothetical protein
MEMDGWDGMDIMNKFILCKFLIDRLGPFLFPCLLVGCVCWC